MAYVQMKCENCGASLEKDAEGYICPHCKTRVIRILEDAGADGESGITAEAFEEALKRRKAMDCIAVDEGYRVFDGETERIRGQLRHAERLLRERKFYAIEEALQGIDETVFAAERLRLLAQAGAADEAELSYWAGDVRKLTHFERVTALADYEQKQIYARIEQICSQNAKAAREILEGDRLLQTSAFEEAERYAMAMCKKYPTASRAWALLIAARCGKDAEYDPWNDLSFFLRCPDCAITFQDPLPGEKLPAGLPPMIRERVLKIGAKKEKSANVLRKIVKGCLLVVALTILALIWTLLEKLFS